MIAGVAIINNTPTDQLSMLEGVNLRYKVVLEEVDVVVGEVVVVVVIELTRRGTRLESHINDVVVVFNDVRI